jgi:geranyl-CoA carboxylase alpha subunit
LLALAAVATVALPPPDLPPMWVHWRSSRRLQATARLLEEGLPSQWQVSDAEGGFLAHHAGSTHQIGALQLTGQQQLQAQVDGRPVRATWARRGDQWWWLCEGHELSVQDGRLLPAKGNAAASQNAVQAPMHGRVTQVLVKPGATVEAGTLLLVMEAMKMEHRIHAPKSGTLEAMHVTVGDQVSARQVLAEMAP